jgi:hypothetical protein
MPELMKQEAEFFVVMLLNMMPFLQKPRVAMPKATVELITIYEAMKQMLKDNPILIEVFFGIRS